MNIGLTCVRHDVAIAARILFDAESRKVESRSDLDRVLVLPQVQDVVGGVAVWNCTTGSSQSH